jgi:hypothetical protein
MTDVNKRVNTDRNIQSLLYFLIITRGNNLLCQTAEQQQITAKYVNGFIYHFINIIIIIIIIIIESIVPLGT